MYINHIRITAFVAARRSTSVCQYLWIFLLSLNISTSFTRNRFFCKRNQINTSNPADLKLVSYQTLRFTQTDLFDKSLADLGFFYVSTKFGAFWFHFISWYYIYLSMEFLSYISSIQEGRRSTARLQWGRTRSHDTIGEREDHGAVHHGIGTPNNPMGRQLWLETSSHKLCVQAAKIEIMCSSLVWIEIAWQETWFCQNSQKLRFFNLNYKNLMKML